MEKLKSELDSMRRIAKFADPAFHDVLDLSMQSWPDLDNIKMAISLPGDSGVSFKNYPEIKKLYEGYCETRPLDGGMNDYQCDACGFYFPLMSDDDFHVGNCDECGSEGIIFSKM